LNYAQIFQNQARIRIKKAASIFKAAKKLKAKIIS